MVAISIYMAVVLVVVVKFCLVRIWYQVKGFCADTHSLTVKAISLSDELEI